MLRSRQDNNTSRPLREGQENDPGIPQERETKSQIYGTGHTLKPSSSSSSSAAVAGSESTIMRRLLKDKNINQFQSSTSQLQQKQVAEKDCSSSSVQKPKVNVSSQENVSSPESSISAKIHMPPRQRTPTSPPSSGSCVPTKRISASDEEQRDVHRREEEFQEVSRRSKRPSLAVDPIEHGGYPREQELAWIPDLDLDLTGFTTSSALEMSERYIDRNMEEVMEEPVPVIEEDHMEEPVPVIEEEGMIEPVPVITTTEHPEEVEYGPPREQELPDEPELELDFSMFSDIANVSAYELASYYDALDDESEDFIIDDIIDDEDWAFLTMPGRNDNDYDDFSFVLHTVWPYDIDHDEDNSLVPFSDYTFDVEALVVNGDI